MIPFVHLIAAKRDGRRHTVEEIRRVVEAVCDPGQTPDYQVAAWLMAAYLNGLTPEETYELTIAMRDSGIVIRTPDLPSPRIDKHSTGGVGDKTTLVVTPLLAALGVPVVKLSGRGLGFTGGTTDKLAAIPGFRTALSIREAVAVAAQCGAVVAGASAELAPADKRLYHLRDVTGTVSSIPLIAASIMSKKLASGADAVVLDVKTGAGSTVGSLEDARALASTMVDIGLRAAVPTLAVVSDMDQPLGRTIGNALEVAEACEALTDPDGADLRLLDLCVELAAVGLVAAGRRDTLASARADCRRALHSGEAAAVFERMVELQGGDPRVVRNPDLLAGASSVAPVRAEVGGMVEAIDPLALGVLSVGLGAGRYRVDDEIDPAVGIVLRRTVGETVAAGDVLAELHLRACANGAEASATVRAAYTIGPGPAKSRPVILGSVELGRA